MCLKGGTDLIHCFLARISTEGGAQISMMSRVAGKTTGPFDHYSILSRDGETS